MDLITIKFIGLILLMQHSVNSPGPVLQSSVTPVMYTMLAADGTPEKTICGTTIPEHRAYLRVVGSAISVKWSTAPLKCETEGTNPHTNDCLLYELDHDDLSITTVSESNVGITRMPTVEALVPKMKAFHAPAILDASTGHARSAATLDLRAGTLEGVPEHNDMRTLKLVVRQGTVHLDRVTIKSNTRADHVIVVPAGAEIAFLNLPPDIAADKPGEMTGHGSDEHWFLHYTLLDNPPSPGNCKHPLSPFSLRKHYADPPNHPKTLNKACSGTTYP